MKILNAGLLALALAASTGAAAAQQQPDAPFPYDQMPTQVVGITPPEGWRTAYFNLQGVVAELGEITPDADVTNWRNLIAYLTVATSTNQVADDMDANLTEVATHCASHAIFRSRPAAARAEEGWGQIVCLDRPGQVNAVGDAPLQIYVFQTQRRPDATFRFWRAWRGTPAQASEMLAQAGVTGFRSLQNRPSSAQLQAAFAPVVPALTEKWAGELAQALEVCELASSTPCASLNRSVADVSSYSLMTARLPGELLAGAAYIQGDNSDPQGAAAFYRRAFGSEPPQDASGNGIGFVNVLTPQRHNFRSLRSATGLAAMMFTSARAGGGLFSVGGDAPLAPAELARMRAYLLKNIRAVSQARSGAPAYDRFRIDLWPSQ